MELRIRQHLSVSVCILISMMEMCRTGKSHNTKTRLFLNNFEQEQHAIVTDMYFWSQISIVIIQTPA